MNCDFCGGEGHEDAPCPVRRESAARYAEEGRKVYPVATGVEADVCDWVMDVMMFGDDALISPDEAAIICREIAARQRLGVQKYGQQLSDNPAPLRDRLRHAFEEVLDLLVYTQWAKRKAQRNMVGQLDILRGLALEGAWHLVRLIKEEREDGE